jgi:phenylacetate-CoA ligase
VYNKEHIPFYAKKYKNVSKDDLKSYEDCLQKIPIITKDELRNLSSPYDLTADHIINDKLIRYSFATSGSTGKPTSVLFTKNDWKATCEGIIRCIPELNGNGNKLRVFNGYNQGHISGPIFNDAFRLIKALPIPRRFYYNDEQAFEQLKHYNCNVIMAPWRSTHKGGSFEDYLNVDAKNGESYINGKNIKALFCSSVPLTDELLEEIKYLGIKTIYNNYGTTEAGPLASNCQENPQEMHLLQGPHFVEVVDEDNKPVRNGIGRVIIGRVASYDDMGKINVNQGFQLLNYEIGDQVMVNNGVCKCGRTSPRISKITRIKNIKDKVENGCQVI